MKSESAVAQLLSSNSRLFGCFSGSIGGRSRLHALPSLPVICVSGTGTTGAAQQLSLARIVTCPRFPKIVNRKVVSVAGVILFFLWTRPFFNRRSLPVLPVGLPLDVFGPMEKVCEKYQKKVSKSTVSLLLSLVEAIHVESLQSFSQN